MFYGIPLFPLIFSIPFYIAAFVFWQKGKRFNENCTKTSGRVVSIDEKGNDLIIRIEYKDAMNKSYLHVIENEDGVSRQKNLGEKHRDDPRFQDLTWKIDQKVDIFYNRNKPDDAIIWHPKMAYAGAIICAVFASFPMAFEIITSLF